MHSRLLCEETDGPPSHLPMLVKEALTVAQASSCPLFVLFSPPPVKHTEG